MVSGPERNADLPVRDWNVETLERLNVSRFDRKAEAHEASFKLPHFSRKSRTFILPADQISAALFLTSCPQYGRRNSAGGPSLFTFHSHIQRLKHSNRAGPLQGLCRLRRFEANRWTTERDRVEDRGLRPCPLPHHRTYRFQYPAVEVTPHRRQDPMAEGSRDAAA